MTASKRSLSGRPEPGEYASHAAPDIAQVAGEDAVEALRAELGATLDLLHGLSEDDVAGLTYAPGKWTFKEVVGHLADDERIYAYRALCLARGETLELPGFVENLYVSTAEFEGRPLTDLAEEYRSVREASLRLFSGMPQESWLRGGVADGQRVTVRGLAFHVAGHDLHHRQVLRERYLGLAGTGRSEIGGGPRS